MKDGGNRLISHQELYNLRVFHNVMQRRGPLYILPWRCTFGCGFNCAHCTSAGKPALSDEFDTAAAKKLVDQAYELCLARGVKLHGRGSRRLRAQYQCNRRSCRQHQANNDDDENTWFVVPRSASHHFSILHIINLYCPLDPKPFAPRFASLNSSSETSPARNGCSSSCAILSPLRMVYGSSARFSISTMISPR